MEMSLLRGWNDLVTWGGVFILKLWGSEAILLGVLYWCEAAEALGMTRGGRRSFTVVVGVASGIGRLWFWLCEVLGLLSIWRWRPFTEPLWGCGGQGVFWWAYPGVVFYCRLLRVECMLWSRLWWLLTCIEWEMRRWRWGEFHEIILGSIWGVA